MVILVQKSYRKNILRDLRGNLSRFLSLFGIVALGVMILTGLASFAPSMRIAGQKYYVQQNVFDLRGDSEAITMPSEFENQPGINYYHFSLLEINPASPHMELTMPEIYVTSLSECTMKAVKIITYYAPIGFFGFFAYLVAYYGPQLMRWLTEDPIAESGGFNLYAFCGNNAISRLDLKGGSGKTLAEIEKTYRDMIAAARRKGKNVAADNLEYFLSGRGGTRILDISI